MFLQPRRSKFKKVRKGTIKKLEFKAQRLDEKTGQRLFERMLNKNLKEDSDAGEMNPLRINDNQKKK